MTTASTAPAPKQRGGARPGTGRKNVLGETRRRDLRVSPEHEKAAILVGNGDFSKGMRRMVDDYLNYCARNLDEEQPEMGVPVLTRPRDGGAWFIGTFVKDKIDGQPCFRNGCTGELELCDEWWPLPAAPGA
jgi:hypothetical protein